MIIKKKCWPNFFEKLKSGEKKFELRLANFECNIGDTLILEEWEPKTRQYTGRVLHKKVAYVIKTKDLKFWSKGDIEKHGYQVISLEKDE